MKTKNEITILYVEDEHSIRERLAKFLRRFCKELYVAQDGEEGLALYKEHTPDIIVSDIRMPKMTGLEMVKKIKELNPEQIVLFLTAHSDSSFLFEAINLNISAYILKPVDLDILGAQINRQIESIQNQRSAIKLKESESKLRMLAQALEQMDEMVRITDIDGHMIYVNDATLENTHFTREELIGQTNRIFKSGKHTDDFYKKLWTTILNKKIYRDVMINKRKDGTFYYDEKVITPLLSDDGEIEYFISTSRDVTDRVVMEEELKLLATKDALTSIYNRYRITQKIEESIHRANRYKENFSLVMIDIDHFKEVNDTYGHDIGDIVLKEMSKIVLNSVRSTDSFGRWGGEEFMLLCTNINKEATIRLAEKIRTIVEDYNFEKVGRITISLGASNYKENETKEELLKRVDTALYEAKASGRNRVVFKDASQ